MGKALLFVFVLAFPFMKLDAQEKFQVSGRIDGLADGRLHVVTAEGEKADTLVSTQVKNGVFLFSGNVSTPVLVRMIVEGETRSVPFILENAIIMLNITEKGALIQGGAEQTLLARYNQVAREFAIEQHSLQNKVNQAGANLKELQVRMDKAYEIYETRTMELITENPNAYATACVVAGGRFNETEESLQTKYNLLGERAKVSVPGKQIAATLERYAALAEGMEIPNFTATRPNGDSFTLNEILAKMKLLVFWSSSDAECRRVNPELIKLYRQFRPKGLEIISISLDENRFEWERAVEQDGLIWVNGCDFQGKYAGIAAIYMVGNVALPYAILIDKENKIVAKGFYDASLRDAVAKLLKKGKK